MDIKRLNEEGKFLIFFNNSVLLIVPTIKIGWKESQKYYLNINVGRYNRGNNETFKFEFDLTSDNWEEEVHKGICEMKKVLFEKEIRKIGSFIGHNLNDLIQKELENIKPYSIYRKRIVNVASLLFRNKDRLPKRPDN